jgi:hypothetical protein
MIRGPVVSMVGKMFLLECNAFAGPNGDVLVLSHHAVRMSKYLTDRSKYKACI